MTPEQFCAEMALLQVEVSDATLDRLRIYAAMLTEWQARMNLVGPATLPDVWSRHFLDSAQLLAVAGPTATTGTWLDIGAGGGFPGLVLAAFGVGRLTLVDSIAKKCRFLEAAAAAMGVGGQVSVQNVRIESLSPVSTDFITARACAPLDRLLGWGYPFSRETTRWLLLKGQDVDAELTLASKSWILDPILHVSQSDSRGRIVDLTGVTRRKMPKQSRLKDTRGKDKGHVRRKTSSRPA